MEDKEKWCAHSRTGVCVCGNGVEGVHLRPLAEVTMQGQARKLHRNSAMELRAPGGCWKHTEEALQLRG